MRSVLGLAMAGIVGCSSTSVSPAADAADAAVTTDVVTAIDATRADVMVTDAAIDRPPTTCTVTSGVPVAYHLSGEGPLLRDAGGAAGTYRSQLDLYLPQGRVAGAPVILAFGTYWPRNALTIVEGRFAADLSVAGLAWTSSYGGTLSFRGGMAAPSGGLALHFDGYLNVGTDVLDPAEASATLCPVGEAPAPVLRSDHVISPRGVVDLVPSAPIAGDPSAVRLLVGGAAVPVDVTQHDGVLTLTARSWLAPGTAVTVDLGGLRDVMGRAFTLDGAVSSLVTTSVVTDRGFDAAPPDGAVASDTSVTTMTSALRATMSPSGPYRMLIALGALGTATRLRGDATLYCPEQTTAWLVGADGTHIALPWETVGDAGNFYARTFQGALSGAGPWWLLVESNATRSRPGWLPGPTCLFGLDGLTTE